MTQVQEVINKLKKEVFITTAIITSVIIMLLLLLPFLNTYSRTTLTYFNAYSSLFFLNDRLDSIYYSAVLLLFHDIFILLILAMSISSLFIQKKDMLKRFKIIILILYFVLGILLIISSLFARNTRNWMEIRFGYNVNALLEFTFAIALLFLLLKEKYQNKTTIKVK